MVWVVKADATCYRMTVAVIYYLYTAPVVCETLKKIQIPDLEGPQCCCWGSTGEVANEGLKWGRVMFVGRMSVSVGEAPRNIWLYRAHFDRPDSQPCPLRWASGLCGGSSAQRKLLLTGSSESPVIPPLGHTGVLMECAATSPAVRWSPGILRGAHKGDWAAGWLNHPLKMFGTTSGFRSAVLKQV